MIARRSPLPGLSGATVADRLNLDESFHAGGHSIADRLYQLVTWAEGDGVFGLDDHEIHPYQVVGGDAAVSGYLLTVQPPLGPQLCYGTLTAAHLLGHDTHGVDAAVHALTVLAGHVTAVLDEQARLIKPTSQPQASSAHRGFAALREQRPASPPPAPPLDPPPARHPHRR